MVSKNTPSSGAAGSGSAAEAPLLPEHAGPAPSGGESASVLGAVFNVSTSVVGAGIMSIPAAMRVLGVAPAVALIAGVAVLANAAVDFMLRYTRGAPSYAGIMGDAFGRAGAALLNVFVASNAIGTLTASQRNKCPSSSCQPPTPLPAPRPSFLPELRLSSQKKMQRAMQAIGSHGSVLKSAVLRHISASKSAMLPAAFSRSMSVSSASLEERGFETATVADIMRSKGKGADGSWLWCTTEDTVYDAVKSMTQHNVGALVVLKPGQDKSIAGIVTERDYLRKIIVQGRSSKSTKVGDIMTEENKLITVKPDTRVLQAMQLMTENRIRHIPVIDGTGMLGMVSIGDVVRAVVSEHREELNRLNAYIQGGY